MSALERAQVRRSLNRLMVVHLFVAACFWGVAVVVVAVILALLDRFGTVTSSALGVGSQVGMWFCFGVGVLITTQYLPSHVAAGVTRRAFVVASIAGALLVGAVYAVAMTVLTQVERAVFGALGWSYAFPESQLFTSTDQLLAVLAQHLLVYSAGGLCGLLVGIVYYRTGSALGTLALLVTVTPLLFVSGVLRARDEWFFVPLPDATWTRVVLVLVVLTAMTTAYRLVARRVPIAPAMV